MRFARVFLSIVAVVVPALETWRRWDSWRQYPPSMLDDYVLGALTLWVVWVTRKERVQDGAYLAAFIGFAVGVVDPSGLPSAVVAAAKGAFAMAVAVVLGVVLRRTAGASASTPESV